MKNKKLSLLFAGILLISGCETFGGGSSSGSASGEYGDSKQANLQAYLQNEIGDRVYFETDSVSEQVATFESENHYIACLPVLEELARQEKWARVTESDVDLNDEADYKYHEEDSVSIMDMKDQVRRNLYGKDIAS